MYPNHAPGLQVFLVSQIFDIVSIVSLKTVGPLGIHWADCSTSVIMCERMTALGYNPRRTDPLASPLCRVGAFVRRANGQECPWAEAFFAAKDS